MIRIILVLSLLLTLTAHAQSKVGIMGSVLYNVPEIDMNTSTDGIDEKSGTGLGLGMRALLPLTSGLSIRTGAGFVEKSFGYEVEQLGLKGDADLSFVYLNIPATLYFSGLDEKFGIFFGTAINAKMSDDCNSSGILNLCKDLDEKSLVFPVILGFDFNISEKVSMELSYEYGIMDTAKDLKVSSAVLSFIYNFR